MKYISLDLETVGLDPMTNNIIEFAAVYDDLRHQQDVDKLPTYHAYVYQEDDRYVGSAYALAMHPKILSVLANRKTLDCEYNFQTTESLLFSFYNWLEKIDYPNKNYSYNVTAAGKNFASFDRRFLEEQCEFPHNLRFSHRVLDPVVLYCDPAKDDMLPDSKECMRRAGLSGEVAHTALEDAKMVVRLIRNKFKEEQ